MIKRADAVIRERRSDIQELFVTAIGRKACEHAKRRYGKDDVIELVTGAGLTPLFCTYFNTWLFPLIAATRLIKKFFRLKGSDDEFLPPAFLNRILAMVFGSERHFVGRVPLPIGSSIILLARRSPSTPL